MKTTDFAKHLTSFLGEYLPSTRNVSENTIKAYRDTFKLFLLFCNDSLLLNTQKITLKKIDETMIISFLDWIEIDRKCSVSTRNHRLAGIHAFYRFILTNSPEHLFMAQKILQIPLKKYEKPIVEHLSPNQVKLLLSAPNLSAKTGRRDVTLLSILYDTAARVSELCDLTVKDVRFEAPELIRLMGKGKKIRTVPLLPNSVSLLKQYLTENHLLDNFESPLFCNQRKMKLTHGGVSYILQKYATVAFQDCNDISKSPTPHILRHSKAMHLYQTGVNLVYIRDILGHSDISTTDIYARADIYSKRKALESVYPNITKTDLPEWNKDTDLLDFLNSL